MKNFKWVIYNQTQDKFWNAKCKHWSNRYYATKYSTEELEKIASQTWFVSDGNGDCVVAVIAISV